MAKNKLNLKDTAYEYIKDKIINGEYPQGEKIDDAKIAEELNMSKTPIRDAIQMLVSQNFLVSSPKVGTTVTYLDIYDIYQLYEPLAKLQGLAAKAACLRSKRSDIDNLRAINEQLKIAIENNDYIAEMELDAKFHRYILSMADNQYLNKFSEELLMQIQRIEYLFLNSTLALPNSYTEHNEIIKSFRKKDDILAEELMVKNWLNTIPDVNIDTLARLINSLK